MDFLVILLAAAASFAIGGAWFSPKAFFPTYEKESKINELTGQKEFNAILAFTLVFLAELLLALLIYMMTKSMKDTTMVGVVIVLSLFVVLSNVKTNIFSFNNFKLFLITEGQKVISIIFMGLLITFLT